VSEPGPVVEARGLTRAFGTGDALRRAVDAVDLVVSPREVVLIFGPSGCGKSTLLGLLGGLDRTYRGELRLFGKDLATLADPELSRLRGERIGFIFQAFHLLGHLSVLDNVLCPALFARVATPPTELRDRGLAMLERVGLADRAASAPRGAVRWAAATRRHRPRAAAQAGAALVRRADG
jgi:putative ABC transport system ATP-binding protein